MKKIFLSIIAVLIAVFGYTQTSPVLKVAGKELGLSTLDIQVDIVGNIATTTYNMLFYNPTNTILEGELSFPLGEGHDVSRFALDVNGKLREAVIVEKELGRIAFESVVRRGVDPALLEKGTGNNYKARIYPIPAKGYKRVVLAYEQELVFSAKAHAYYLPLQFKNKLDLFKLSISVFDQKYKPVIENGGISGLEFSNWNTNYTMKLEKQNYIANTSLSIQIPLSLNTEKILTEGSYFYVYKTLTPQKRQRESPDNVTIYWDASMSRLHSDLAKELDFLDHYFTRLKNSDVRLVIFNNSIQTDKNFTLKNGNWTAIRKEIEQVIYDGGTNYGILSPFDNKTDAILLFTDGVATLSEMSLKSKSPVFIVNTSIKSNHIALKNITEFSNGSYLNLQTSTIDEAVLKTVYESYKFLGYETEDKALELYPVAPITASNDFSISGKNLKNDVTLVLKFGYGSEVIERIPITINTSKTVRKSIRKIWAQKKIEYLMLDAQKNKQLITNLGKEFGLVTNYTSLIVLDNVRDYLRYKITPPKELLEEYNLLIARQKEDKETRKRLQSSRMLRFSTGESSSLEIMEDSSEVDELAIEPIMNRITPMPDMILDEVVDIESIEEEADAEFENISFVIIEETPIFPGCSGSKEEKKRCFTQKINQHFDRHFNSELANSLNLSQGLHRIYATFTINKQGNVIQVKARAPHRKLEEEAIRVLRLLPKMNPGKQRGRPVSVKYTLPIVFRIDANGQRTQDSHENRYVNLEEYTVTTTAPKFKKYQGDLRVKERVVTTVYLKQLRTAKNKNEAYIIYLKQRMDYLKTPAYFIDVSNFFKNTYKDTYYGSKIVSNIAEIDFDNYELLKVFAYQLQQNHQNDLAIFIYKRILQLRPEDSQSYRDLALAYLSDAKCQEALDLYNSILTGAIYENKEHRRVFNGVKEIVENEIKHLLQVYKGQLDTSKIDKELLAENSNYDIRVTVDWNHNDTDIDLHIIDPLLEECFYKHSTTGIGGKISEDMTQGFGPEEFTLKHAIKGNYYIKIKYYGDQYQKVENPTFMKVTIYKKYGSKNETSEIHIIRLTKNDNEEVVASLTF